MMSVEFKRPVVLTFAGGKKLKVSHMDFDATGKIVEVTYNSFNQ